MMEWAQQTLAGIADWLQYSARLMPSLLQGLGVTLRIFLLTLSASLPLGLLVALMSIAKVPPLRWIAKVYVLILRGTPLMLQLFFVYFGLPAVGLVFDRFGAAVVAFILNYSAYFAEIYRAGIQSIGHGQYEAAKVLGFTPFQTLWRIIIPQTISRIVPPIGNEIITLVKDTALVTAIGVAELLKAARGAVNRDVNTTAFLLAAMLYLAFTVILTLVFNKTEKYFSRYSRR